MPQPKEIRDWLKLSHSRLLILRRKLGSLGKKEPTLRRECSTFRKLALFATWLLFYVCIPSVPVCFKRVRESERERENTIASQVQMKLYKKKSLDILMFSFMRTCANQFY